VRSGADPGSLYGGPVRMHEEGFEGTTLRETSSEDLENSRISECCLVVMQSRRKSDAMVQSDNLGYQGSEEDLVAAPSLD
jgi:hypothetical protein